MKPGSGPATIALVAGGTAGHIAPALAVAEELAARDLDVVFLLARRTPGQWILQDQRFGVEGLDARAFYGESWPSRLALPFRVAAAARATRGILQRRRARLLVVFGGYGSVDAALGAASLRIPILVHEANAIAGLSNRIVAPLASRICLGSEAAAFAFARRRCTVTGNPVRRAFAGVRRFEDSSAGAPTARRVLVIGGSLGSAFLDVRVPSLLAAVAAGGVELTVTHLTGNGDAAAVQQHYASRGLRAHVQARSEDMPSLLQSSDFVISRAGAMSITEIAATATPALFVPLPGHAREHQTANVRALERRGDVWWTSESEWDEARIAARLARTLRDEQQLAHASRQMQRLAFPDAAGRIAELCRGLIG